MPEHLFAVGASLAAMTNVELLSGVKTAPADFARVGGAPMPLRGSTAERVLSGALRDEGAAISAWVYPTFENGMAELNALLLALFNSYAVTTKKLYVSTTDERGHYSPFLVDLSYGGAEFGYYGKPLNARFDLFGGVLQYTTVTGSASVTAAQRLLYADTSGGDVTRTLFDPATATPYTVYSAQVSVAGNDLIVQDFGGTPTLATVDGLLERIDVYSDGAAWNVLKTGL